MMELNEDNDDSDRTESYTPPPLDTTNDLNNSMKEENCFKDISLSKQRSILALDQSFNQILTADQIDIEPQSNSFLAFLINIFCT